MADQSSATTPAAPFSLDKLRSLVRPAAPLVLLTALACGRRDASSEAKPAAASEELAQPYPLGTWRLAPDALGRTVLTVSHILVVHEGSQSAENSLLRAPRWSAERSATRTREQARARALSIAAEARATPERFAELARRYSDDLTNNERGGSLGSRCSGSLPAPFLDALTMMRPGETSRVVETELGFHVLRLRPPAPETRVAARHILVSYRSTAPFYQREKGSIERSREQAEQLAQQIATEVAADPRRFDELLKKHTEHADVLLGGDFGLWSSTECSLRGREIEAIGALRVGASSGPIDGFDGFNVFLRTEASERPELAATYLRVKAPDGDVSRLPGDVLRFTRGRTGDFDALQAKYNGGSDQWQQGRGDPRVEHILSSLEVGAASSRALDVGADFYQFHKRVQPAPKPAPEPVAFELPKPTSPNVDTLVARASDGQGMSDFLSSLQRVHGESLGLDLEPERRKRCAAILARLAEQLRKADAAARGEALAEARQQLAQVLDQREFAALQANIRSELTRKLMTAE